MPPSRGGRGAGALRPRALPRDACADKIATALREEGAHDVVTADLANRSALCASIIQVGQSILEFPRAHFLGRQAFRDGAFCEAMIFASASSRRPLNRHKQKEETRMYDGL